MPPFDLLRNLFLGTNNRKGYIVAFGKMARTITYKDRLGTFVFTLDCDILEYENTEKVNNLYLSSTAIKNKKVLVCKTQEETDHLKLMVERVRGYLESCGYKVDIE